MESRRLGFLDLPLEIRDQIYECALVACEQPLVIYHRELKPGGDRGRPLLDSSQYMESTYLKGTSSALIRACKATAAEAPRILYGKNSFAFNGDHEYKHERNWLTGDCSTSTRVAAPDGTREGHWDGFVDFDNFHARHPLLQRPEKTLYGDPLSSWQDGIVEDIDPDMEAFFSLLGNSRSSSGAPVAVMLRPRYQMWPAVRLEDDEILAMMNYFGTDLPNLVEAWRATYSVRRNLDITWAIQKDTKFPTNLKRRLCRSGWLIVDHGRSHENTIETFYCKRRAQSGPIIADWESQDINDTGRYSFTLAYNGEFGLYECKALNPPRLGEVCRCAELGWELGAEGARTSLAPFQPIWPKMPAPGLV